MRGLVDLSAMGMQYAPVTGGYGAYLASKYIKTGEGPE